MLSSDQLKTTTWVFLWIYLIVVLIYERQIADPEEVKKKQEAVSNQGKKKWTK